MKKYQFPTTSIGVEDRKDLGLNLNSLQMLLEKKFKEAEDQTLRENAAIVAYGIVMAIGEKLL